MVTESVVVWCYDDDSGAVGKVLEVRRVNDGNCLGFFMRMSGG